MTCDHCGAPRPDGARACPFCKTAYGGVADAPTGDGARPPIAAPPGVVEAIDRDNLIEAIRLYRAATRTGLREAKSAVEAIARARRGR